MICNFKVVVGLLRLYFQKHVGRCISSGFFYAEIKGEVTLLHKMIIIWQCLFHFMLVTIKAKPLATISKGQKN